MIGGNFMRFLCIALLCFQFIGGFIHQGSFDKAHAMIEFGSDLQMEKTLVTSADDVTPGSTVQYELLYSNVGSGTMLGGILSDTYGAGLTFSSVVSSTPSLGAPAVDTTNQTIQRSSVSLAPNATGSVIVEFVVDAALSSGDTVMNESFVGLSGNLTTTCVGCTEPNSFIGGGGGGGYIYPEPVPPYDLTLTKEATSINGVPVGATTGIVQQGDIVEFTLTISNDLYTGNNIRLVDFFEDRNIAFSGVVSSSVALPPHQYATNLIGNSLDGLIRQGVTIVPGATETIVLAFEVLSATASPMTNYARLGTYDPLNGDETSTAWFDETDLTNNSDEDQIESLPFDLQIDKSIVDQQATYVSGDIITFRFDYSNNSVIDIDNIAIVDIFPNLSPGLTYVSHTSDMGNNLPTISYSGSSSPTSWDEYNQGVNYTYQGGMQSGWYTAWTGLQLDAGDSGWIEVSYIVPCGFQGENHVDITLMDGAGRFLQVRDPITSCNPSQYNDCHLYIDDQTLEEDRHNNYDDVTFDTQITCGEPTGGPAEYDREINYKEFTDEDGNVITSANPGDIVYATVDGTFNESGSVVFDEGYISDYWGDNFVYEDFISNDEFFYIDETPYIQWLVDVYAENFGTNTCNEIPVVNEFGVKAGGFPLLTGNFTYYNDGPSGPSISSSNGCGFDMVPTGNAILDADYAPMYAAFELAWDDAHDAYYQVFNTEYDAYIALGYTISEALIRAHIDAFAAAYQVFLDRYTINGNTTIAVMYECAYNSMYEVALDLGYTPTSADGFALNYAATYSTQFVTQMADQLNTLTQQINSVIFAMGYQELSGTPTRSGIRQGLLTQIDQDGFMDYLIAQYEPTLQGPIREPKLYYLGLECDINSVATRQSSDSCGDDATYSFGGGGLPVTGQDWRDYLLASIAADEVFLADGAGGFYALQYFQPEVFQDTDIAFSSDGNGVSLGGFTTCPVTDTMQMTIALEVQCPQSGAAEVYTNTGTVSTSTTADQTGNNYVICDADSSNVFCGYDVRDMEPETLFGNFSGNNITTATLDVIACPTLEVSIDSSLDPDTDGDYTFDPGDDVTYSAEVCNDSTVIMDEIVYTEMFNPQVLIYSGTTRNPPSAFTTGDITRLGGTIMIENITLNPGECVTISHEFRTNPNIANGQTFDFESSVGYYNEATDVIIYDDVLDNNYDGETGDVIRDPFTPPPYPAGSKTLSSPTDPTTVQAGSMVVYEITVQNPFTVPMYLDIIDAYNTNLIFDSIVGGDPELGSPMVITGSNMLEWNQLTIPAGASRVVQVQYQVNPDAIPYDIYTNTYQFFLYEDEPLPCECSEEDLSNNSDVLVTPIVEEPVCEELSVVSTVTVNENACGTADGSIEVIATSDGGGAVEYSMDTVNWQTDGEFTGLGAGMYTVYVRGVGQEDCDDLEVPFTITAPGAPIITVSGGDLLCEGGGNIQVDAPSGSTISWTGPGGYTSTLASDSVTSTGMYIVTVTQNGCDAEGQVVIDEECDDTPTDVYDLALVKSLIDYVDNDTSGDISVGDDLEYTITVINQGTVPGTVLELVDYTPAGLVLNDTAWTMSGGNAYYTTAVGPIPVGGSMDVGITYTIDVGATGSITNWAEISEDDGDDVDSDPNDDKDDDAYGDDDQEDGDGTDDEDDHDPETFTIGDACIDPTITVTQTGPLTCGNDTVTLTASGAESYVWSTGETTASIEVSAAGTYTVTGTEGACDEVRNVEVAEQESEILLTDSYAIDLSTCESSDGEIHVIAESDAGGTVEYSLDGATWQANGDFTGLGVGTYVVYLRDGTEALCDEVSQTFTIGGPTECGVYDLALVKSVVTPGPYTLGGLITYSVKIINQGTLVANDVEITDYTPEGLILNDSDRTLNGGNAVYNITTAIAPGASVSVDITYMIDPSFNGSGITNWAEISDDDGDDIDSNADDDETNDEYGNDDQIDGDGTDDEDDNDPSFISLEDKKGGGRNNGGSSTSGSTSGSNTSGGGTSGTTGGDSNSGSTTGAEEEQYYNAPDDILIRIEQVQEEVENLSLSLPNEKFRNAAPLSLPATGVQL